jgi:hypothetical protein
VRSSRPLLSKVPTPVYLFQGRRDFAFDISQAIAGYRLLKGPKHLYIGPFRMIDDATLIPRRSRLRLMLASNSVAHDPANLLYLNLPMPAAARISIGEVKLVLPMLQRPVSRWTRDAVDALQASTEGALMGWLTTPMLGSATVGEGVSQGVLPRKKGQ